MSSRTVEDARLVAREKARLAQQEREMDDRFATLWREAPARAWDWLCRVREHESVPGLSKLNPVIQEAVRIRLAMARGHAPTFYEGESGGDWRIWMRYDGRQWDQTTRIPFDQPMGGTHRPVLSEYDVREIPHLISVGRGGIQRAVVQVTAEEVAAQ